MLEVIKGTGKKFYCYNCGKHRFRFKQLNQFDKGIVKTFFVCCNCGKTNSLPQEHIKNIYETTEKEDIENKIYHED